MLRPLVTSVGVQEVPHADDDPDVLVAIESLAKIANNTESNHRSDLRIRATLALTMFLPSPTVNSSQTPTGIRNVATEALNR